MQLRNKSVETDFPPDRDRNHFNFLRLVFATLVLLSHAFELVDGNRSRELLTRFFGSISFGEFAVDGFFLVSGYLIVQSWKTAPHVSTFLIKRILRIYPAFIVASVVSIFIVGPLAANASDYLATLDVQKALLGFVKLSSPVTPPVFVGQPYPVVNGSMWTIKLEFACYVLVLALGLVGFVRNRRWWFVFTAATVGLFTASVASGIFGFEFFSPMWPFFLQSQLLRLVMFFSVGGCFYLFRERIPQTARLACLVSAAVFIALFDSTTAELVLAIGGGYLLFFFAFASFPFLQPFSKLPDVSYGLYLYGWPIQKLLIWTYPGMAPEAVFVLSLLSGLMAGCASWYLIEKPFLRLKPRQAQPLQQEKFATVETSRVSNPALLLQTAHQPMDTKV
jgi:peptidoglycan/LPS O-acetylase OafA/YrhL